MAIMQDKLPFVFGIAVLATALVAAPAAHAICKSPKNICKHFDDCLQRTSDPNTKDADGSDHCPAITLAEPLRRASHWFDPP